jgi:hypothetical protein
MNDEVRGIRREISQLKHGRRPTAVRYPVALRRKVAAIARQRRAQGTGLASFAREVGLARWTVGLWVRNRWAPVMRAVDVVPDTPPPNASAVTGPVLITPDGVRIEGARIEELTTLLRALR